MTAKKASGKKTKSTRAAPRSRKAAPKAETRTVPRKSRAAAAKKAAPAPKRKPDRRAKPAPKPKPAPARKSARPDVTKRKKPPVKAKPVRSAPKKTTTTKAKAPARPAAVKKAAPVKAKPPAAKPAPKPAATLAKPVAAPAPKPVEKPPARPSGRGAKALDREFLTALATAIQEPVRELMAGVRGREGAGEGANGAEAAVFLEKAAERALLAFLREAKAPVAYYSEESGYTTFTSGQPENLLIIDPLDGARAARSGFESCTVSIATTRVIERPRIADLDNALVLEVMGPRVFFAERGNGARVYEDGKYRKLKLSTGKNLEAMSWSMAVTARPAELIFPTAAKLIDTSSLKGGFFACNCMSFSLTRLLTGQLDACVDFANRYLRDIPSLVEDQFINAGRGAVTGITPHDVAASLLIAKEAGCAVTDAHGHSFDEVLVLDTAVSNQLSLIAAANAELHAKLMSFFDTRIRQFEELFKRRAAHNSA